MSNHYLQLIRLPNIICKIHITKGFFYFYEFLNKKDEIILKWSILQLLNKKNAKRFLKIIAFY